jgi:hypothetical protein
MTDATLIIRLLKLIPPAYDKFQEFSGRPSRADGQLVKAFVRRLDERRVFYAPFHSECVEMVVGSLQRVVDDSLATHASLTHGLSQAAVGLVLDATRKFLDRWSRATTPPQRGRFPAWFDEETARFFEDLGELRGQVRTAVELLREFSDPALQAPSLLGDEPPSP